MSNLANMSPQAIAAWQRLNELWGKPIPISSAYRDPETNRRVKGAKGSQHLHGNAFDIPTAGMSPQEIDALIKAGAKAGFRGFGGYGSSVHFDVGPQRTWGPDYSSKTTPQYLKSALSGAEFSPMNFSNPTMSTKGGGTMTPDQIAQGAAAQSTGMQPAQMEQAQQPRGGLLGNLFGDQDTMARLAIAFNSMRLNPDPNIATLMNAQMKERRDTKRREDELNKTIAFFDSLKDPTLSKLARVNPTAAFNMYQRQVAASKDPNVQSSQSLPGMSGTILTMRDGSQKVLTVGGEELTGQAAVDFVNKDRENYIAGQRSIYGARREGTLGADIELGGEAERAKAEGKDAPRIAAQNLKDASLVRSSITNIDNAIAAIDEGAQSGMVYNMLPDFTLASASLTNAMNRLGLDVIGSVTFGALSAPELALAMETAVPRNLQPAQLREWLVRHKAAQEKAYLALIETAQHFAGGGSMADYLQKIKVTSGNSQMPSTAPQPSAAPRATHRYNPTTKQVEEIKQ